MACLWDRYLIIELHHYDADQSVNCQLAIHSTNSILINWRCTELDHYKVNFGQQVGYCDYLFLYLLHDALALKAIKSSRLIEETNLVGMFICPNWFV